MKVSLIAAVSKNQVIGNHNALPWYLPEDLAFFKNTTMGSPVLMGRKTYESINRPLPGRVNVVLTNDTIWYPAAAQNDMPRPFTRFPASIASEPSTQLAIAHTLADAFKWLEGYKQVFLIGGSNLYTQALDNGWVDELILTEINQEFEGDAYFPKWDKSSFQQSNRTHNPANKDRPWSFDFVRYQKKATGVKNDKNGKLR